MAEYLFSPVLAAFRDLAVARMRRGLGAVLMLEGPAGGGKTSFAEALASELGGQLYFYSGTPDKERDLLYEIDVDGVLQRENAWAPGAAWQAFEASTRGEFAVLLIDELDKTNPGFDSFLLRLLQEWHFDGPGRKRITADPSRIVVVLTSNGRRSFREELKRRCQRVQVPLPTGERLRQIIQQAAGYNIPTGLLELVIRLGDAIRKQSDADAPSPKELAMFCVDAQTLAEASCYDNQVWREVGASWLVKSGGAAAIDKDNKFDWAKALRTEATRRD